MKVSCICPTYDRAAVNQLLLDEAVHSFLVQSYPDRELIIINDCPGQTIVFDHPLVRVVNVPARFKTLGDKYNAAIRMSRGDAICCWEDDDISLPDRILKCVESLAGYDYFNPLGYWLLDGGGLHHTHPIGYAHSCSIFTREAFERVGGYPETSGPQDAILDGLLRRHCRVSPRTLTRDFREWQYIYRWGISHFHLSSHGDGSQQAYDDYSRREKASGTFRLNPRWAVDYPSLIEQHLEKHGLAEPGNRRLSPAAAIDLLARVPPASPLFAETARLLDNVLAPGDGNVDSAPRASKFLTIAMATYDDFDGVYFTVQSIRVFHSEVADEIDFLVLDNQPGTAHGNSVRQLGHWIPELRYLPYTRTRGTAVRDVLFREATSEFVLCIDPHVLIAPGALARLIDYLKAHRDTSDLMQGPLLYDDLRHLSTHFEPQWRAGMFGTWATDARGTDPDAAPFEIGMQGLGLFACRRDAWPGLNPRLRGFGGEEGYLHEKVRRAGGRTICLPFLGWLHRFGRPNGTGYRNAWEDRIRNYGLMYDELGWDPSPMIEHFSTVIDGDSVQRAATTLKQEIAGPFHKFDAIYAGARKSDAGRWERMIQPFAALGIEARVRRFDEIETPADPQIGHVLSHRAIIEEADRHGLQNVLVIGDDVVRHAAMFDGLDAAVKDVKSRPWWALTFGADCVESVSGRELVCGLLRQPLRERSMAYNRAAFEPLLAELPRTPAMMALWLRPRHPTDDSGRNGARKLQTVAIEAGAS